MTEPRDETTPRRIGKLGTFADYARAGAKAQAREQTTLKPCPFCGGNARVVYCGPDHWQITHAIAWGEDYDVAYFGECDSCKATAMCSVSQNEAAGYWNRRV